MLLSGSFGAWMEDTLGDLLSALLARSYVYHRTMAIVQVVRLHGVFMVYSCYRPAAKREPISAAIPRCALQQQGVTCKL
jgi:hypothetical protein